MRSKSGSCTADPHPTAARPRPGQRAGAGRFAPSPTGPLHLGSLLAALASYADARSRDERWLLRLDDLDERRNQAGADAAILHALECHGLHWDGPVQRQSQHLERYREALRSLADQGLLFRCRCSRRILPASGPYPGSCRAALASAAQIGAAGNGRSGPYALRIRVDDAVVRWDDLVCGAQSQALAATVGDFVVCRRDGVFAYQLATAVDDASSGITRVIRGSDLLDNTGRQLFLMQCLGLPAPRYGHIPVLVNETGQKLSKQTGAPPLNLATPERNILQILTMLGMPAPAETHGSVTSLVAWTVQHWSLAALPCGPLIVTS
ncbi:MAG: tRNA glutamyl-Q(34) synthetase GluQRS [Pseudomonadales bacterium]